MDILVEGLNDGHLKNEYCMSKESLLKLHSLLKPALQVSIQNHQGDAIDLLSKVMMVLRYFASSRWVNNVRIHGVSKAVLIFYRFG